MLDALLAYAHFFSLFAAFGLLVAEWRLFESSAPPERWRRLAKLDIGYFVAAIAIIVTGLGRVFYGVKGPEYYWHNLCFHGLLLSYLAIGLLSILPTLSYIRWAKQEQRTPGFDPGIIGLGRVRLCLRLELLLFCIAPLFAVLMARGFGA